MEKLVKDYNLISKLFTVNCGLTDKVLEEDKSIQDQISNIDGSYLITVVMINAIHINIFNK